MSDWINVNNSSGNIFSLKQPVERIVNTNDFSNGKFDYREPFSFARKRYITPISTAAIGGISNFEIPRTSQKIGWFVLEIGCTSTSTATDVGEYPAYNMLKRIEFEHGGVILNAFSGYTLLTLHQLLNGGQTDIMKELYNMSGGIGTDLTGAKVYIFLPFANTTPMNFNNNGPVLNALYPIGASNNNLRVNITFNTAAYVDKNGFLGLGTLKLHYYEWIDASTISGSLPNTTVSTGGPIWSQNSWYIREQTQTSTITTSTDFSLNCDNILVDGEVDFIGILIYPNDSNKEYINAMKEVDYIKVNLNGTDIYEHDTKTYGRIKTLLYNRSTDTFYSSSSAGHYTAIINFNPKSYLSAIKGQCVGQGINMNLIKPTITINDGTLSGAYFITSFAVYKCMYLIDSQKNANYRLK